jgi:hypothetical protein
VGRVMDVNLVGACVAVGITILAAGTWIAVIWQLRTGDTETNRAEINSNLS